MKTTLIRVPSYWPQELADKCAKVARRVGLSNSMLVRTSMARVLDELDRTLDRSPKKTIVQALLELKGLDIPERHCPVKRRP